MNRNVQSIKLASIDSGITSQILSHNSTGISSSEGLKCAGPTALTGIHESILWHVDSLGKPFMIPLSKPSLRAKIASAQGDPKSAALLAEQGTSEVYYKKVTNIIFRATGRLHPCIDILFKETGCARRTALIQNTSFKSRICNTTPQDFDLQNEKISWASETINDTKLARLTETAIGKYCIIVSDPSILLPTIT